MKHQIITPAMRETILNNWPKSADFKRVVGTGLFESILGASEAKILLMLVAEMTDWLINSQNIHPDAEGFDSLLSAMGLAVSNDCVAKIKGLRLMKPDAASNGN